MLTGESRFKLETCLGQCAGAAAQCSQGSQLAPGGERQGESNNGRRRAAERQRRKMSPHLKHSCSLLDNRTVTYRHCVFRLYTRALCAFYIQAFSIQSGSSAAEFRVPIVHTVFRRDLLRMQHPGSWRAGNWRESRMTSESLLFHSNWLRSTSTCSTY